MLCYIRGSVQGFDLQRLATTAVHGGRYKHDDINYRGDWEDAVAELGLEYVQQHEGTRQLPSRTDRRPNGPRMRFVVSACRIAKANCPARSLTNPKVRTSIREYNSERGEQAVTQAETLPALPSANTKGTMARQALCPNYRLTIDLGRELMPRRA